MAARLNGRATTVILVTAGENVNKLWIRRRSCGLGLQCWGASHSYRSSRRLLQRLAMAGATLRETESRVCLDSISSSELDQAGTFVGETEFPYLLEEEEIASPNLGFRTNSLIFLIRDRKALVISEIRRK